MSYEASSPNVDLIGVPGMARSLTGPALIIRKEGLVRNIETMQRRCHEAGMTLRPHAKTHKSATIARHQLDAGAAGICCATAYEALILGKLGIRDILLTSPVVEPRKIRALADLSGQIDLTVVVDSSTQIDAWEVAMASAGGKLDVLVDIDLGMGRTGVQGDRILELASRLASASTLNYSGVQAYSGLVQHIPRFSDRRHAYVQEMEGLQRSIELLKMNDLAPRVVSGGGTGTMEIDCELKLFNELQCGSYIFMDVQYLGVQLAQDGHSPYAPSLFVRGCVISANVPGKASLNAGFKSLSTDGPSPAIMGEPEGVYEFFGDEYGRVRGLPDERMREGSVIDVIVPHCDTTVNLHRFYHVIENDSLVDIWPIDARGVL